MTDPTGNSFDTSTDTVARPNNAARKREESIEEIVERTIRETGHYHGFKTSEAYFASSEWAMGLDIVDYWWTENQRLKDEGWA